MSIQAQNIDNKYNDELYQLTGKSGVIERKPKVEPCEILAQNIEQIDERYQLARQSETIEMKAKVEPCEFLVQKNDKKYKDEQYQQTGQSGTIEHTPNIEPYQFLATSSDGKNPFKSDQLTAKKIEKKHKCETCYQVFSRPWNLRRHKIKHKGFTEQYLGRHEKTARKPSHVPGSHSVNRNKSIGKTFECDICGKLFMSKAYLIAHILHHMGINQHKCNTCHVTFCTERQLDQHRLIHTGEKNFECDVCCRRFALKGTLKTHMLLHTGERPYACGVCMAAFPTKQRCYIHYLKIHTGDTPYSCQFCRKAFTSTSSRYNHIVNFHTARKYTCDVCGRLFAQKGNLTSHTLSHFA